MSSRRQLLSRSQLNDNSSPLQRRSRNEEAGDLPSIPLPPYEPPSCPLTASQKRALDELRLTHDYSKYKKHLAAAKKTITIATGESNDRFTRRRDKVRKTAERIRQQDRKQTEGEMEEEQYTKSMEKKVGSLTEKAEKAMRDLIDYTDELAMHDPILTEISENIADAPALRPAARRQRRRNDDGEGYEEDDADEAGDEGPAADASILSAVELLKKAKENYVEAYTSKSMRERYVNNDYRGFKQTLHDALHPGDDAPPVPHPSTWFPTDPTDKAAGSRSRRLGNSTDNMNNASDEDDDVIIASATTNLKCPLTLQMFVEPYSNTVCKHTFEKAAIIAYHHDNAVAFAQPGQRRGHRAPEGPKQVKCPQLGCEAMLELSDFYDDQLIIRQVKRAQRKAALEREEDDDEIEPQSRGVEAEGTDDEDQSVLHDGGRRHKMAKTQGEHHSHRGQASGDEDDEDDGV